MYLSTIWLALAFILLHDKHPLTSLGVFNIFLIHRLLEQKYCKKRKKKS
jgi:hypothetical protein